MKMCNCNQGRLSCTCRTVERASVPRELTEQRQGETVTLPARLPVRLPEGRNLPKGYAEAWNACIDEIAKLGPLYTHPAPAAQKGEPVAWSPVKPSTPGAYWVRGNGLDQDALIQVIDDQGELRCNLHQRTTEADFGWGYAVSDLSEEFEWLGPLYTHADAGEVERLRGLNRDAVAELEDRKREIYALRAQLAERDALLRDISKKNDLACDRAYRNGLKKGFGYGINGEEDRYNSVMESYHRSIAKALAEDALSASAEPSAPTCWPCWSCKEAVSMLERDDADGDCPHCGVELDLEDWPVKMISPSEIDERAEFEVCIRREWSMAPISRKRDLLPKDDPCYGDYCDEPLQRAWVGWQMRATLERKS